MSEWGYVLFYTSAAAFKAERAVKDMEGSRLVPTPREFSSDCGVALRFRSADRTAVRAALEEFEVPFERFAGV